MLGQPMYGQFPNAREGHCRMEPPRGKWKGNEMNLLELRNGLVHADAADGIDYTLCGVSAEIVIHSRAEYHPENETETEPYMIQTDRKITCPKCAMVIRYCVALGTRAIGRVKQCER